MGIGDGLELALGRQVEVGAMDRQQTLVIPSLVSGACGRPGRLRSALRACVKGYSIARPVESSARGQPEPCPPGEIDLSRSSAAMAAASPPSAK